MELTVKPKLEDVARAAGVSTATVSRCLNEPGKVTEKTREKVLRTVETLGYTPNFGGRALASRRTYTVGAVIPTMENAIFARGLQAFQEALAEDGITLLVASSGYDTRQEEAQIRALVSRGADGILLIGTARSRGATDFLRRLAIPYVIAWSISDPNETCVGFDNVAAARMIAERVIALGHRKIAMISGLTAMNDRASGRVQGVRMALADAGLDIDGFRVEESKYAFDAAGSAFECLMKSADSPTAVICGNDVLGVGAIAKARALGLRVPEDVSITGFDDIDVSAIIDPPLTTVHVPHQRMGVAAAKALLGLIDNQSVDRVQEIETMIVERGSLGPPPS
ncbi:LacI family DNA-binding transcriptional regulator [Fulvimarina sp. MAC8]|uniref:LacI family DNA-binding transcriptional regulator n=1 Tax=Fulvimarina sp. MAC8 TaxID=3162874 RepID=UPI0032F01470